MGQEEGVTSTRFLVAHCKTLQCCRDYSLEAWEELRITFVSVCVKRYKNRKMKRNKKKAAANKSKVMLAITCDFKG